tara:strand:- start:1090 stop:2076 length:987 start_codon:yes stop_codon:yes gene_type:complete
MIFSCDHGSNLGFESDNIMSIDYGVGAPCGGSVMSFNGYIYRTYDGGAAPIDDSNLDFLIEEKIGNYNSDGIIYHSEVLNGNLWFSVVTYDNDNDFVKVVNSSGQELASYEVGLYPGDFASWNDYAFIANEGNFGSSNGSISMIDAFGSVINYENIGDVVQSIEVYGDKLIVLINNSHKIKIFDINSTGLQLPGIEVETGSSSPREMVVFDNKVYFTNWDTQDIKVFNLYTYQIENSVSVLSGLPEDIIINNQSLYVTIPNIEKYDQNLGSEVIKINISDLSIEAIYDVGLGPEFLAFSDNGDLYISRKTYSQDWYTTYHGTSKINMP